MLAFVARILIYLVESTSLWQLVLFFAMLGGAAYLEDGPEKKSEPKANRRVATESTMPTREGGRIENRVAKILLSGERYTVQFDGETGAVVALENLALQRIADALQLDSQDTRWSVTGRVTEFQGSNYFLIERAVRAGRVER